MGEREFDNALDTLGWRQVDLARRLGLAPESISRMRKNVPKYVETYLLAMVSIHKIRRALNRLLEP